MSEESAAKRGKISRRTQRQEFIGTPTRTDRETDRSPGMDGQRGRQSISQSG